MLGFGGLFATGATGAAIPRWFLANYTIDTALAPKMRTWIPADRRLTTSVLAGMFLTVELLHLVLSVPLVEHLIGWLLFRMIGFLWSDDVLPTGRRLVALAWLILLPIVAGVARVERGILFAERSVHHGGLAPAVGLVSTSIKVWSLAVVGGVVAGALGVLAAAALLRPSARHR
ncbi:MAG: hypothetical protein ACI8V4_001397 [Ilumatobacter sp.]